MGKTPTTGRIEPSRANSPKNSLPLGSKNICPELSSTAKVFGDVKSTVLTIAAGAIIHGKCQVGEEKKSKPEKITEEKVKLNDRELAPTEKIKY